MRLLPFEVTILPSFAFSLWGQATTRRSLYQDRHFDAVCHFGRAWHGGEPCGLPSCGAQPYTADRWPLVSVHTPTRGPLLLLLPHVSSASPVTTSTLEPKGSEAFSEASLRLLLVASSGQQTAHDYAYHSWGI